MDNEAIIEALRSIRDNCSLTWVQRNALAWTVAKLSVSAKGVRS